MVKATGANARNPYEMPSRSGSPTGRRCANDAGSPCGALTITICLAPASRIAPRSVEARPLHARPAVAPGNGVRRAPIAERRGPPSAMT